MSSSVLSSMYKLMTHPSARFYKEEVGGETETYMHIRNRCSSSESDIYTTLQDVAQETLEHARRIDQILKTQGGKTEEAWKVFREGYMYVSFSLSSYLQISFAHEPRTVPFTCPRPDISSTSCCKFLSSK